jgi:thiol-disulfide isomerase/thioredoxin
MKNNRWILGLVIVVVAIGILSYLGFKRDTSGANKAGPQTAGESSGAPIYFDDNASVMYFYQDTCGYCIKEKDVLTQLGNQGYRVKPMNIGANHPENQSWWQQYGVSGTPTFIAKNGDKLEPIGYQDYGPLKAFLDKHK